MMKNTHQKYHRVNINDNFIICDDFEKFKKPIKSITGAFDTETIFYFKGKQIKENELKKLIFDKYKRLKYKLNELRQYIHVKVWSYQLYTKENGFFMTNDFETYLQYCSKCGIKFLWCYNATFDFSQMDYFFLTNPKWKLHDKNKHSKNQSFTYSSMQNNMGARYSYKVWVYYKNNNRNKYTHAITFYDFMKFVGGGLKKVLSDLNVIDENTNQPIRKLEMDYQNVNIKDLSDDEIDYCKNDVSGLYYAIKILNNSIEETSNNECSIFGKETNILTCGGFAKRELLRFLYPTKTNYRYRIQRFKELYPLSAEIDKQVRENFLYKGGITLINKRYKGILINKSFYKYDVNSEYPFMMYNFRSFKNRKIMTFSEFNKIKDKENYECILVLKHIEGKIKTNKIGVYFDNESKSYVDEINEDFKHYIFYDEFVEYCKWYDFNDVLIEKCVVFNRGDFIFRNFVEEKYKLKEHASHIKNASLKQVAKLTLNSSYGKLAERIEKQNGHYEINEETGCVHYVNDEVEICDNSSLNVLFGAKITSMARCYLLSKIREICEEDVLHNFIYCDTDSIHAFKKYDKCDDYKLGYLKCEGNPTNAIYLLPKTYIDIYKSKNKKLTIDDLEIHSKGINVASIKKELGRYKRLTLNLIKKKFNYGVSYLVLTSINVIGGKALIPQYKYLAKENLAPDNYDEELFLNNTEFMFLGER